MNHFILYFIHSFIYHSDIWRDCILVSHWDFIVFPSCNLDRDDLDICKMLLTMLTQCWHHGRALDRSWWWPMMVSVVSKSLHPDTATILARCLETWSYWWASIMLWNIFIISCHMPDCPASECSDGHRWFSPAHLCRQDHKVEHHSEGNLWTVRHQSGAVLHNRKIFIWWKLLKHVKHYKICVYD